MPKIWYEGEERQKRRNRLALGALIMVLCGALLQNTEICRPLRAKLQDDHFEMGEQDITKLHYLLINNKIVAGRGKEAFPSTTDLPEPYKRDGLPTLSITTEPDGLYSSKLGIFPNYAKKGRNWERKAFLSYFEGGELRYEAPVGLRVHGGTSRAGAIKSLQIVFRRSYSGEPRSTPGLFFNGQSPKLQRVVLSNTVKPKRFLNPIALELAQRAGCLTSRTQPVRVVLNGDRIPAGYFMIEHQSREFLKNIAGHDHFEWIRLKGNSRASLRFDLLRNWIYRSPAPMTMEEAGKRFNMEDLANWVLAVTYCGTTDEDQGGYFLDLNDPDAKWRCLAWDMDGSFDHGRVDRDSRFKFATLKGVRGRLFRRLVHEDPEFREFFRAKAEKAFQTIYSPTEISGMIQKYRGFLESPIFEGQVALMGQRLTNTERNLHFRAGIYLQEFDRYMRAPEGNEPPEGESGEEETEEES